MSKATLPCRFILDVWRWQRRPWKFLLNISINTNILFHAAKHQQSAATVHEQAANYDRMNNTKCQNDTATHINSLLMLINEQMLQYSSLPMCATHLTAQLTEEANYIKCSYKTCRETGTRLTACFRGQPG